MCTQWFFFGTATRYKVCGTGKTACNPKSWLFYIFILFYKKVAKCIWKWKLKIWNWNENHYFSVLLALLVRLYAIPHMMLAYFMSQCLPLCPSLQPQLYFSIIFYLSSRCPLTFLFSFQILPLPSALQSPHFPHLSLPTHLPTCTSSPDQPPTTYITQDPLFVCQFSWVAMFLSWLLVLLLSFLSPGTEPAYLSACYLSTCYLSTCLPVCLPVPASELFSSNKALKSYCHLICLHFASILYFLSSNIPASLHSTVYFLFLILII